jgi:outer membrane protein OmpA-like peptidoglycan-associated protein
VRYNQILSERRAESTRNYLALKGYINARRLQFQGYGEMQPIVPCPMLDCTDEEHQLNRRSEFEIIEY